MTQLNAQLESQLASLSKLYVEAESYDSRKAIRNCMAVAIKAFDESLNTFNSDYFIGVAYEEADNEEEALNFYADYIAHTFEDERMTKAVYRICYALGRNNLHINKDGLVSRIGLD